MGRRKGAVQRFSTYDKPTDWYREPDIRALSDAAFRLREVAIAYCNDRLTDGVLPDLKTLAGETGMHLLKAKRAAAELLAAGKFIHTCEHDANARPCGVLGEYPREYSASTCRVLVKNFHKYNPSSQEVQDRLQAKSRAGTIGNHKRWHSQPRDGCEDGAISQKGRKPSPSSSTSSSTSTKPPLPRSPTVEQAPASKPGGGGGIPIGFAAKQPRLDEIWRLGAPERYPVRPLVEARLKQLVEKWGEDTVAEHLAKFLEAGGKSLDKLEKRIVENWGGDDAGGRDGRYGQTEPRKLTPEEIEVNRRRERERPIAPLHPEDLPR